MQDCIIYLWVWSQTQQSLYILKSIPQHDLQEHHKLAVPGAQLVTTDHQKILPTFTQQPYLDMLDPCEAPMPDRES